MVTATIRSPTEADKYLDSNSFSWNLDSTVRRGMTSNDERRGRQQRYLDKPRPFKSNIDMVSSNFSGARFKRSSDIPPELKNVRDDYDITTLGGTSRAKSSVSGSSGMEDAFDITTAPFSTLDRTSSIVRDANAASSKIRLNGIKPDIDNNDSFSATAEEKDDNEEGNDERQPAYDEVMYWLLTHLPNVQEDDAISYFHHLLEDGFDNIDTLKEIIDEDLYFMKKGHRRALMRSLSSDSINLSTKEDADDDAKLLLKFTSKVQENGQENNTLDETTESKGGSCIAEKDQLDKERLANKLAESEEMAVTSQKAAVYSKDNEAPEEEEFEDITRSSFVDKPSLSSSSTGFRTKRRLVPSDIEEENEEVYDITRDAFSNRPSLSAAPGFQESLSTKESTLREKGHKNRSSADGMAPNINAPSSSSSPSYDISIEPAPRAVLYQFYIDKGLSNEHAQKLKSYFTTWTNGAKSHELRFTCIFTCPVTGEHFASGNYRTAGSGINAVSGIPSCQAYWYSEFRYNYLQVCTLILSVRSSLNYFLKPIFQT
jgi:hypothetical protein